MIEINLFGFSSDVSFILFIPHDCLTEILESFEFIAQLCLRFR